VVAGLTRVLARRPDSIHADVLDGVLSIVGCKPDAVAVHLRPGDALDVGRRSSVVRGLDPGSESGEYQEDPSEDRDP
jgi:hypothetical protein